MTNEPTTVSAAERDAHGQTAAGQKKRRLPFLDNLRWICILLLFPYHTCMVFHDYGERFYVWSGQSEALSLFARWFLGVLSPVLMPLMFLIAGISMRYSLRTRSVGRFATERVVRLLRPLGVGILTLAPIQAYFAERFWTKDTAGGLWESLKRFFWLSPTLYDSGQAAALLDANAPVETMANAGYLGGFAAQHMWFIFFLFLISMAAIPFALLWRRIRRGSDDDERRGAPGSTPVIATVGLLALSVVLSWLLYPVLEQGGKSIVHYLGIFLLGYFVYANERVQRALVRIAPYTALCFIAASVGHMLACNAGFTSGSLYNLLRCTVCWLGVAAALGCGRRWLGSSSQLTGWLSAASFPAYLFHQTWLVAIAYFSLRYIASPAAQFAVILFGTLAATAATCELVRRVPLLRSLFGIKAGTARRSQVSEGVNHNTERHEKEQGE